MAGWIHAREKRWFWMTCHSNQDWTSWFWRSYLRPWCKCQCYAKGNIRSHLQFGNLLYTTMLVKLADQSIRKVEGIAEDVCIRVGSSYVPVDFMVLDTDHDLKALIILEHPFLHTTKATIHAGSAKISFQIKDRLEKFSFKNSKLHCTKFLQEQPPTRKSKKEKNQLQGTQKLKFEQGRIEFANMINTLWSNYDHLLAAPFNTKKGDLGLPTIECTIGQ